MKKTSIERAASPVNRRRWGEVRARKTMDGAGYVYAVRSTKIYCRPSCPSRRPRRNRVIFFSGPREAERAGFRPCRRCRPEAESPEVQAKAQVERICRRIEGNIASESERRLTLAALSAETGLSPHQVERKFRQVLGITPKQFADARRLSRLKIDLQKGENVAAAMYGAGYGSSSRLYERALAQMGMTPATYRRGGAGMRIGYTIVPCSLGRLLVGATTRGISAVYLGESEARLRGALAREYPRAEIRRDANGLGKWVRGILKQLRGREPHVDLPLDVQATAFQRRVWKELQQIPSGSTRSYREVARAIGRPTATRAVARACATNPVSIVVPCHRVVRVDGGLGGYRWGLDRKRALIEQEKAASRHKAP